MKATGSVQMTTVNPQIMLQLTTTDTPTDTMVEMTAEDDDFMGMEKQSHRIG